jgi:hypothetical protein
MRIRFMSIPRIIFSLAAFSVPIASGFFVSEIRDNQRPPVRRRLMLPRAAARVISPSVPRAVSFTSPSIGRQDLSLFARCDLRCVDSDRYREHDRPRLAERNRLRRDQLLFLWKTALRLNPSPQ